MAENSIKILTYNVHSCIGQDKRCDPGRIADVIARSGADIIALQELDVGRRRTGGVDQAHAIAARLDMAAHFHPSLQVAEEQYGDAILTALPARLMKAEALPSLGEQRGAIWVETQVGNQRLHVINTHLGLRRRERMMQATALLGADWLSNPQCRNGHAVLCGDLNAVPSSTVYRMLNRTLADACLQSGSKRGEATFPARYPLLRLDHILISERIVVTDAAVMKDPSTRIASDHLPVVATLEIRALLFSSEARDRDRYRSIPSAG